MLKRFAWSACLLLGVGSAAAQTPSPAPPRCDAACLRANLEKAAQACARPIEAQAPIDYEWITRPFAALFDEADPSGPSDSIVSYRGDSIRFLTAQKEWVRVSYECAYDVAAQKLVRLNVRPGRLGRPQQQAVAAPAPRAAAAPQTAQQAAQPQIRADMLAAAIAKAASQNAASNAKAAQRPPSRTVRFGEPSAVEIMQVQ